MMNMKRRLAVLVLAFSLLLSLAGLAEPALIPGELTRPGLPFQTSYPDNPVLPGVSPFTGLPFEGTYAPVMLVMGLSPLALPHWGIQDADIIFQAPNGGSGATKLIALFSDKVPSAAGGSRSARAPFITIAQSLGAAISFAGSPGDEEADPVNVPKMLRDAGMRRHMQSFDLISNNNYSERVKGKPGPHNLSVNMARIQQIALENGQVFTPRPFLFREELPQGYPSASRIEVNHYGETVRRNGENTASYSGFIYQPEQQVYYRENHGGSLYVDRDAPDSPLAFANVVVLRVDFSYSGSYLYLGNTVGNGAADIFIGGSYIRGGWHRDSAQSRFVLVDDKGEEIALQPGKSFIIVTNEVTQVAVAP